MAQLLLIFVANFTKTAIFTPSVPVPEELVAEGLLQGSNVEVGVGSAEVLHGDPDGVGCFALHTSLNEYRVSPGNCHMAVGTLRSTYLRLPFYLSNLDENLQLSSQGTRVEPLR